MHYWRANQWRQLFIQFIHPFNSIHACPDRLWTTFCTVDKQDYLIDRFCLRLTVEADGRIVAPPTSYNYPAHFKSALKGILHCFVWASFAILLSLFWATCDDHGRKHKHALKHVDGGGRQQQLCSWRTTRPQSHTGTSKHSRNNAMQLWTTAVYLWYMLSKTGPLS